MLSFMGINCCVSSISIDKVAKRLVVERSWGSGVGGRGGGME